MYQLRQQLEPVHYPVDQVFNETLQSRHIPDKLGPVRLTCADTELRSGTQIVANLGVLLFKFRFPVEVTEVVEDRLVRLEGENRDAKVAVAIVFNSIQRHRATNVNVDFVVDTLSTPAQKAEKFFGPSRCDGLTGNVLQSIFDSVVHSLDNNVDQSQQSRSA